MSSMHLFVASGLFTLGVFGGGGFDKDTSFSYKEMLQGAPAFTQVHNEVMAYDYLRVSTIGAELKSETPSLKTKLHHIDGRLDKILGDMTGKTPGQYAAALDSVRKEAKKEVLAGKWSPTALEAYADAAIELDRGIAGMGETAITTIKHERNESLLSADRMASVTLGYTLGDIYHAWEGDLDDGLRGLTETYSNEFADLTSQLDRVMTAGQGVDVTARYIGDPFDLPTAEDAENFYTLEAPNQ